MKTKRCKDANARKVSSEAAKGARDGADGVYSPPLLVSDAERKAYDSANSTAHDRAVNNALNGVRNA